jgi:predicted nucleic acid-binding Zn ribbon protein
MAMTSIPTQASSATTTTSATTCTVCGAALRDEDIRLGQPFITARQLVTTIMTTAVRAPGVLSDLLFKELDQVPYCAECRDELAAKRTGEQLKFLLGVLLIMALVIGVPLYLMIAG